MFLEPSNPTTQRDTMGIHYRESCSCPTHQHSPSPIYELSLHPHSSQTMKTDDLLEKNRIAYFSNTTFYPTQFAFFLSSPVLLLQIACLLVLYSNEKETTCLLRCHVHRFWKKLLVVPHFYEKGSNKLEGENYARQSNSKEMVLLYQSWIQSNSISFDNWGIFGIQRNDPIRL